MDAGKLVQALAVAWSGTLLYPDPTVIPTFTAAVDTIGSFANSSVVLGLRVDGFSAGGETVPVSLGAADRLVEALFAQRVESLAVMSPPTPEEMITFFAVLADEEDDDLGLDLPTRLSLAGVAAVRVRCQALLQERHEEEEPAEPEVARHPDVQALFEADSVQVIAERVMAATSPELAAEQFLETYRAAYARVTPEDPAGLGRVVQTFVDAFFRLDRQYRVPVFEAVIAGRDEIPFQNFLDQMSADELAELAGEVKDAALPLLVEYARVVGEMQGRDPGLVERVMGGESAADARAAVAGSVGMHLAGFLAGDTAHGALADALVAEVAELASAPSIGAGVLGDLFTIERRPERLGRLCRVWAAKLGRAIRAGQLTEGVEWLQVVEGAGLDARILDDAFGLVGSDEILGILTDAEAGPERDELLAKLSRRAGMRVLEQLATEEDPGRRRMLIDLVTEIARVDIRSVLPGLADPRWYVVRNIAIALGKSARKAAREPLARLLQHEDHRVRIEALRALLPCAGDAAVDHLVAGLGDSHVRVRASATDLLGALDDAVVVPALASALRDETRSVDERVAVIEALGRHSDASARAALAQLADGKTRFSGSARTLRAAAREALRSGHA